MEKTMWAMLVSSYGVNCTTYIYTACCSKRQSSNCLLQQAPLVHPLCTITPMVFQTYCFCEFTFVTCTATPLQPTPDQSQKGHDHITFHVHTAMRCHRHLCGELLKQHLNNKLYAIQIRLETARRTISLAVSLSWRLVLPSWPGSGRCEIDYPMFRSLLWHRFCALLETSPCQWHTAKTCGKRETLSLTYRLHTASFTKS